MKIALLTANIGNFDQYRRLLKDPRCESIYYTESNLPRPLTNLNNRLKGKYLKIKTHNFLGDHDFYIWTDAKVEIITNEFITYMISKVEDHDIAISLHPDRTNVHDEINYILDHMARGSKYLTGRYKTEPFIEELKYYDDNGYDANYPLYACRFFIRKNTEKVNKAFDDWWDKCLEFSNFDQSAFSYIAWKHDLKINNLDHDEMVSKYLTLHNHAL